MNEPVAPQTVMPNSSWRFKIMRAVNSPLGFYVLSLLIVESFLFGCGCMFGLSEQWKLVTLGVGVGLFVMVQRTVTSLVRECPKNLVFSEQSYVEAMKIYGTQDHDLTQQQVQALPPARTPTLPLGQQKALDEGKDAHASR